MREIGILVIAGRHQKVVPEMYAVGVAVHRITVGESVVEDAVPVAVMNRVEISMRLGLLEYAEVTQRQG